MSAKVDKVKCDKCGTCIAVCPFDAIVLELELIINANRCTDCGKCCKICPFGAMHLQKN